MKQASEHDDLTLTEAARLSGRSRVTMRRYLDAGKFPHAHRGSDEGPDSRVWQIPQADLDALGLLDSSAEVSRSQSHDHLVALSSATGPWPEIINLQVQLAAVTASSEEKDRTIELLRAELEAIRTVLLDLIREAVTNQRS